ncbi:MAG: ECF-type sigma factor [Planctomycetota bacterium]
MRYFAGLSVKDTASALDLSPATVKRDWRFARTWLHREMSRQKSACDHGAGTSHIAHGTSHIAHRSNASWATPIARRRWSDSGSRIPFTRQFCRLLPQ